MALEWNIVRSIVLPNDVQNLTIGQWHTMSTDLLRNIKGGRLHWRAATAWKAMRDAAALEDIKLETISSGDTYRTYQQQLIGFLDSYKKASSRLWNR